MIKRRFYKLEHGDRDAPSESSSSDSELEAEATEESSGEEEEGDEEEEEGDDNEGEIKVREKNQSHLSSSGYESENSSANEVNLDSSGLPTSDDDAETQHASQIAIGNGESVDIRQSTTSTDGDLASNLPDCAVKCKSVFKCRLCPRIVCLTEETLQAHLLSKRHARSVKLLKEGRLKLMLNDDGKVEGETPEKQALTEEEVEAPYSVKNNKGKKRNRFSKRPLNKKKGEHARFARKDFAKKRHL